MKSNNSSILFIVFTAVLIALFFYSCVSMKMFTNKNKKYVDPDVNYLFNEHFNKQAKPNKKLLHRIKYKCNGKNQEHAYSPEICCLMKNGAFTCDNNRNCRCKNKNTGYCETCYPPVIKKKMR
jgi:hypothetical protein